MKSYNLNSLSDVFNEIRHLHGKLEKNNFEEFHILIDAICETIPEEWGDWFTDYYQCGSDIFCFIINFNSKSDGKTYSFKFYDDGSDTIKDDEICDDEMDWFLGSLEARNSTLPELANLIGKQLGIQKTCKIEPNKNIESFESFKEIFEFKPDSSNNNFGDDLDW